MQTVHLIHQLRESNSQIEPVQFQLSACFDNAAYLKKSQIIAELSTGLEEALTSVIISDNLSEQLERAYEAGFPDISAHVPLEDRFKELQELGPEHISGFISNLKGKLAEIQTEQYLNETYPSYTFQISESQNEPVWDILGRHEDGLGSLDIQVKTGEAGYSETVIDRMIEEPDVFFVVSEEIRNKIINDHPELTSQFIDTPLINSELTAEITDELDLIANALGIEIPIPSFNEIVPFLNELALASQLVYDVWRGNKSLSEIPTEDKRRVQAISVLIILQRYVVSVATIKTGSTIGATLFGPAGLAIGIAGSMFLSNEVNKRLQPKTKQLALDLSGLTRDDLFYIKNKVAIDGLGPAIRAATGRIEDYFKSNRAAY